MLFIFIECENEEESFDENEEVWEECTDNESDDGTVEPLPPKFSDSYPQTRSATLLIWVTGFVVNFKAKYYISDAAINMLLKFFHALFTVLGLISPIFQMLVDKFPKSLHAAQQMLGLKYNFTKYVVCRSCWKLYSFDDAMHRCGSLETSKECSFIRYPNHPQQARRKPCQAVLLKTVEMTSGRRLLYPHKMFCYRSLRETLQELLLRPGFVEDCDHWRGRQASNKLRDAYDSKIWKQFETVNGCPFLAAPYT